MDVCALGKDKQSITNGSTPCEQRGAAFTRASESDVLVLDQPSGITNSFEKALTWKAI